MEDSPLTSPGSIAGGNINTHDIGDYRLKNDAENFSALKVFFKSMISRKGNRFNCCESVLIKVNKEIPLSGFNKYIMRIASNFGGGVGGYGSICGAASGGAIAFGLLFGTEGNEPLKMFLEKRKRMRDITKKFFKAFEDKWGHFNCLDLLGVDFRVEPGTKIYEEMKARGETYCDDYVEWSFKKVVEIIRDNT